MKIIALYEHIFDGVLSIVRLDPVFPAASLCHITTDKGVRYNNIEKSKIIYE